MSTPIETAWQLAKARYASLNIDVEAALEQLDQIRCQCTAGRVTMWPDLRTPADH